MFSMFSSRRAIPIHPELPLLKKFATELDKLLIDQGLEVLNSPDRSRFEVERELTRIVSLVGGSLFQIQTTSGPLFTRTLSDERQPVDLATPDEIREYFTRLAAVTLEQKKGTCVGLSLAAITLAVPLLAKDPYRQIKVELCGFRNWAHVFVRLVHPDRRQVLFYDPWYQRCHTDNPTIPMLIDANEFVCTMNLLLRRAEMKCNNAIRHSKALMDYDPTTQLVIFNGKINLEYDLSYCVHFSSGSFSNPTIVLAEPCEVEPGCCCL